MKASLFISLFLFTGFSLFSQQYPFNDCWLFRDTTLSQGYVSSPQLDSSGRVFITLYFTTISENIIFDGNGVQIDNSPYPFAVVALSGNYYRTHPVVDLGSSTLDIVVEKVAPLTGVIWTDTLGAGNAVDDEIFVVAASGEKLIVGGASSTLGEVTGFIAGYDETGTMEWYTEIGANDGFDNAPHKMIRLSSGNYLVQGTAYDQDGGNITVTNIDTNGLIIWETTLEPPYSPEASGLVEGENGDCYVLTTTIDLDDPYANQLFIVDHLDENGNASAGSKYYYDQNIDLFTTDSHGNLLLCSSEDAYGDIIDIALHKFNSDLDILWEHNQYISFPENVDIAIDGNDNVYWLANSAGFSSVNHGYLFKYSASGVLKWQMVKGGSTSSNAYHPQGLSYSTTDHLLMVGVEGDLFESSSLTMLSINPDSTINWEQIIDTIANPVACYFVKLNDEEYYLPGKYYSSESQQGHFCLKLCTDGIPLGTAATSNPATISIFPNPVIGNATLEITGLQQQSISVRLINIYGREVFHSYEGMINGTFTKELDLDHLPPGTYVLNVTHNEMSEIRKIIVGQ
jgi:hypothetical protein